MADPIKIRATVQGDVCDIRMLLQHPMETGQRKDEKGLAVPAHFIQAFAVTVNGRPLIEGQLNTAVAKNPLFSFKARGVKAGDRVAVTWIDNRGERQSGETTAA